MAEIAEALIAPALCYTPAPFNMAFPGTMSISAELFQAMVGQLVDGLQAQGFGHIYFLNGHGGNIATTKAAFAQAYGTAAARGLPNAAALRCKLANWFMAPEAMKPMKTGAVLKSNSQFLRVAYACNQPAVFTTGVDAPTKPTDEASSLLRWCIQDQHKNVTMATVLSPGKSSVKVDVTERGHQIVVQVAGRNWERDIVLSKQLKMAKR